MAVFILKTGKPVFTNCDLFPWRRCVDFTTAKGSFEFNSGKYSPIAHSGPGGCVLLEAINTDFL